MSSDPEVQRCIYELLSATGRQSEAEEYRIALLRSSAREAVRRRNVTALLANMAGLELAEKSCPRPAARFFTKLLTTEQGCKILCSASGPLLERYPTSVLLIYVRAVGLAKLGYLETAYEIINRALRQCRKEISAGMGNVKSVRSQARHINRLNSTWEAVDYIGYQGMMWPIADLPTETSEGGLEGSVNDDVPTGALNLLALLRATRRQDDYLAACRRRFEAASTLLEKLKAIQAMLAEGSRRMADYHDAYALARECYAWTRPHWEVSLGIPLKNDGGVAWAEDAQSAQWLIPLLRLANQLGFMDDTARIVQELSRTDGALASKDFRWQAMDALAQAAPKEIDVAKLDVEAGWEPSTERETRAFFSWANTTDQRTLAHELFFKLSPKMKRTRAILPYANICEREGNHHLAETIISALATEMARRPHALLPFRHWELTQRRRGEVAFSRETAKWYEMVPQPSKPKGVVFVSVMRPSLLRTLPLVVLMELKRQGWAVVPLVEGILPMEPTGVKSIDRFIWIISRSGLVRHHQEQQLEEVELCVEDIPGAKLTWRDIDLSHAMWESATIHRRRYSVDFSCPALIRHLEGYVAWTNTYIRILENARISSSAAGIPFVFIAPDVHRLPNAAFRLYCEKYGDPKEFFCVHTTNAYENYFSNFTSEVSTRLSLQNITATPCVRTAFLPEPEEFDNWYLRNRDRVPEMLRAVKHVVRIRRSTGEAHRSPDAEACLSRISAWHNAGGQVACLFGKVVCDLAVPYDGGPAHASMRDWLNHSIAAVRDSNVLLLVKPHPHEHKNDIGLFLTEHFEDLIEEPLPDNAVILGHNWFDMHELGGHIDLGILYNGTAAVELGLMGIPAVLCSHFGPIDYPIGHTAPRNRNHYERLVQFEESVVVAPDLRERSAAWLTYLNSEDVSAPYRYYARQMTNRVIYPPWWFREDIEKYLRQGDPHVERLAARVTGIPTPTATRSTTAA